VTVKQRGPRLMSPMLRRSQNGTPLRTETGNYYTLVYSLKVEFFHRSYRLTGRTAMLYKTSLHFYMLERVYDAMSRDVFVYLYTPSNASRCTKL